MTSWLDKPIYPVKRRPKEENPPLIKGWITIDHPNGGELILRDDELNPDVIVIGYWDKSSGLLTRNDFTPLRICCYCGVRGGPCKIPDVNNFAPRRDWWHRTVTSSLCCLSCANSEKRLASKMDECTDLIKQINRSIYETNRKPADDLGHKKAASTNAGGPGRKKSDAERSEGAFLVRQGNP